MKLVKHHGCGRIAATPPCCHRPGNGKYGDVGLAPPAFTVVPRSLGRKEDVKIFLNPG